MPKRKSYKKSCEKLIKLGWITEVPPMPEGVPKPDDSVLGLSFFRTSLEDENFEGDYNNLTLPRTFICRSNVEDIDFEGTDFSESWMCWNDFTDALFCNCDLRNADLRASRFMSCEFMDADLRGCDLRHSQFIGCFFDDAKMKGAVMTRDQIEDIELDEKQERQIDWRDDPGPEPDGG